MVMCPQKYQSVSGSSSGEKRIGLISCQQEDLNIYTCNICVQGNWTGMCCNRNIWWINGYAVTDEQVDIPSYIV